MKQSFQLPCICNLACLLGCISCSIYVRSSPEPLCIHSDLRLPSKQNPFVKGAENRINRKKTFRQFKRNVLFSKFSGKEQIKGTLLIWQIYRKSQLKTSFNLLVATVSQLLNRNRSLSEVGFFVVIGAFLVLFLVKPLKVLYNIKYSKGGEKKAAFITVPPTL